MRYSVIFVISLLGLLLLLGSCTASRVNKKLLIGTWKQEKFGPYIKNQSQFSDSLSDEQSIQELRMATKNSGKDQEQLLRSMRFSTITFKENKTAFVSSLKKEQLQIYWKINLKGNKITIKNPQTSKKFILQIDKIDSLHLKTRQTVIGGRLQQSFKKQK